MKTIILVIGPESTGTRIFAEIISEHPKILGASKASKHFDALDDVWKALGLGDIAKARHAFTRFQDVECLLTRRSMPHARVVGETALFMDFVDLWAFHQLCQEMEFELILLITLRSPVANLTSWTVSRASPGGSLERAKTQYHAAYCHLFEFLTKSEVPFFFLSLEALLLDKQEYVQSIFQLLDFPEYPVKLHLRFDVNQKHYAWYREYGISLI